MSKNSKINRLHKTICVLKEKNKQLDLMIENQKETILYLEDEVKSIRGRVMKILKEINYQLSEHIFERNTKFKPWE
jgi:predicted RNase H-like nuclease (RuvC/YqgF family)